MMNKWYMLYWDNIGRKINFSSRFPYPRFWIQEDLWSHFVQDMYYFKTGITKTYCMEHKPIWIHCAKCDEE